MTGDPFHEQRRGVGSELVDAEERIHVFQFALLDGAGDNVNAVGDDRCDLGIRFLGRRQETDVAAGGFAESMRCGGVHFESGGVGFHVADGRFGVFHRGGITVLGREPVIDAEPGESGVGERIEYIDDVLLLVAGDPAAAIKRARRGERTGPWDGGVSLRLSAPGWISMLGMRAPRASVRVRRVRRVSTY